MFELQTWLCFLELQLFNINQESLSKCCIITDTTCVLCSKEPEDIEHLLFKCECSATVLKMVTDKFDSKIAKNGTWTWTWTWLARRKMGKIKKGLCLVYTTMVYAIWNERNTRVHGGGRENGNSNNKGDNTYYYKQDQVHSKGK